MTTSFWLWLKRSTIAVWASPFTPVKELQRVIFTCEPVAATVAGAWAAGLAASVGLAASAGLVAAGCAAGAAAVVAAGLAASVGFGASAGLAVGAGVAAGAQADNRVSPAAPAMVLSRERRVVRVTVPS